MKKELNVREYPEKHGDQENTQYTEEPKYLTDSELEELIRETESRDLIPAPPDMREYVLEVLGQEKTVAFKRYRLRVLTSVAAAVAVVFLLPKPEGIQKEMTDVLTPEQKPGYVVRSRYDTREEALKDKGMLEKALGGVNIFADNSRLNLFRE